MLPFLGIFVAIGLMFFGEKLPNQTKSTYIEKGYDWNKALIQSNIAGILAGLVSFGILQYTDMPAELNPGFIPFATTITAYITMQSVITDLRILVINRNILRVAYGSMFIASLFNVFLVDAYKMNKLPLFIFVATLFALFVFSPIGPSDIRAIAVALPYTISMGGYLGVYLLIFSLLTVSLGMELHRQKLIRAQLDTMKATHAELYAEVGEKEFRRISRQVLRDEFNRSDQHATPVGPFMIIPFLIFFIIYPFL